MRKRVRFLLLASLVLSVFAGAMFRIALDKFLFCCCERNLLLGRCSHRRVPRDERHPRVTVLFVGDSIIEGYPFAALFPARFRTVNRGLGSDDVRNIGERCIEEFNECSSDAVVFEGGINDILGYAAHDQDKERTLAMITGAVEKVLREAQRRNVPMLVASILPVTRRFLLPYARAVPLPSHFDVAKANGLVREANARLHDLCQQYGATYVDLHGRVVADTGEFDRAFAAADGYHVNVFGYSRLTPVLVRHIESVLEARQADSRAPRE